LTTVIQKPFSEVEQTLTKTGRVEELIRLYESRAREVPDSTEAVHLLCRAAQLANERLANPLRSEELLLRALASSPRSVEALRGLLAVYEQRADAARSAEILERWAQQENGSVAASLYLKAGELHETKTHRRDRAVVCYQLASRAVPTERQAYRKSRAILLAEGRWTLAFESLERERVALGDAEILEEYLQFAERLVDEPQDHSWATKAIVRAFSIDGHNARAQAVQKEISRLEYVWKEKAKGLKSQSLGERDRKKSARLSLRVAKLYAFFDAEAVDRQKEALDRCFALWPAMPEALDMIEAVALRAGDLKQALTVFSKMSGDARDKQVKAEILVRMGQSLVAQVNDRVEAAEVFLQANLVDPSRPDAAELACELLIEAGRAPEALMALERHLTTRSLKHEQIAMRLMLAELSEKLLANPQAATAHLAAAQKLDPDNSLVAFRLLGLTIETEPVGELWPLLELAAATSTPKGARIEMCERLAQRCEDASEPRLAMACFSVALMLDAGRVEVFESLHRAAKASHSELELLVLFRRAVPTAPDAARPEIWRYIGRISLALEKSAEAHEAWVMVKETLPNDPEALAGLEQCKKALEEVPQDARALLEAQAQQHETTLSDPSAAAAVYRRILELEPNSVPNLKKLGALCASLGQWSEVGSIAEKLMALAETPSERQEWRMRLAQLFAERLGRKDESAQLYLGLLAEGVEVSALVSGLERLCAAQIRQAEIARALAPVYAKTKDFQRQVASLLLLLASTTDLEERRQIFGVAADTHEKQLLNVRAAFELRGRLFFEDVADIANRHEGLRLAILLHAEREWARMLIGKSDRCEDAALATTLCLEAADASALGHAPAELILALRTGLAKDPQHRILGARLLAELRLQKKFEDAETLLRSQAEADVGFERMVALAELQASLGREAAAGESLCLAVQRGADAVTILPQAISYFENAGQPQRVVETMAILIGRYQKDGLNAEADALELRRAKTFAKELGDAHSALQKYADVLAKNPSDAAAEEALEPYLVDEQFANTSADILLKAFVARGDARKQVMVLNVLAQHAFEPRAKLDALRRIVELNAKQLKQPEHALAASLQALRLAPTDETLLQQAHESALEAEMADSLAEELEVLLTEMPSAPARRELVALYEQHLGKLSQAQAHVSAILESDPMDRPALQSLVRISRATANFLVLEGALRDLSLQTGDLSEKTALQREAAMLCEVQLKAPERAAKLWRALAERDVGSKEAASALERLYAELDDPEALSFALELRRNQEIQNPHGLDYAFRLASLRQNRLQDEAGAVEYLRHILTEEPRHEPALDALEQLAHGTSPIADAAAEALEPVLKELGLHHRRVTLREQRMLRTESRENQMSYASGIRSILERDLKQPDAALMHALKQFADGFNRAAMIPELERLALVTDSFESVAEIYESTAEELDAGSLERVQLFVRAAQLREQLGENEEAIANWNAVLISEAGHTEALERLSQLYEKSKSGRHLVEVYTQQATLAKTETEQSVLFIKAARAAEDCGDDEVALKTWLRSLALDTSVETLSAVERLQGRLQQPEQQSETLRHLIQLVREAHVQQSLFVKRGKCLEKTGQFDLAVECFGAAIAMEGAESAVPELERMLLHDRVRVQAALHLEQYFRAQHDPRRLADMLDIQSETADPARRLVLLKELSVCREQAGQPALALSARLRAYRAAPFERETFEALEKVAVEQSAYEELAAAFEETLEIPPPSKEKIAHLRKLGALYEFHLSRFDLAINAWNEVIKVDPKDAEALQELARMLRSAKQLKELSVVLRRQLALESDPQKQIRVLHDLARLSDENLGEKPFACQCYEAILETESNEPDARRALLRLYSETEQWSALAALISREIEIHERAQKTDEALDLSVRLARLKFSRLAAPQDSLSMLRNVLSRKPRHASAVGALEEITKSNHPLKGEAASILEPIFETEGDHLKHVQMLEARVGAEQRPTERAALLRRMADLYANDMSNEAMAFVVSARALRESPDEPKNLEFASRFVKAAEAEDELMALLVEVAPRAADDLARASLFRALARMQAQADEEEAAAQSWKRVLELSPTDSEAMPELGRLLARQGRSGELLEVLKRQLNVEENLTRRTSLMLQISVIQEEQLKDVGAASTTLRRLLELDAAHPEALARMEKLCEVQQRWPELSDILSRRLRLEGIGNRTGLVWRLATLRETRLLDRQGAIELYGDLLKEDPNHADSISRLQGILLKEPQNQDAARLLIEAFRLTDPNRLAQVLEARSQVSPDVMERKGLLTELAKVREAQTEPELAWLAWFRAFKDDPNDPVIRQKLVSAASAAQSYDELADALRSELPRIIEPTDTAEMCLTIAQVFEQHLKDKEEAAAYFEKARELAPALQPRVLPALDRIYGELALSKKQADIIETLALSANEPAEVVALNFRMGQLAMESLDDPDRAAAAFERVFQVDSKHLPTLRALEVLYSDAKSNEKLYKVLSAQREMAQGPERERVLVRMAMVSSDGDNVEDSVSLYRELLQKNPRNEQAFEALSVLLDRHNRGDELRELLQWKLQFTVDPRELVRLNERVGRVLLERLKRPADAVPFFKAALERDARNSNSLEALRDIFEATNQRDDLIVTLRRLIPLQDESNGVKQVRIRMAECIAETPRREEALDAARRALEVEPHSMRDLERINAVFFALKAWPDAVRALDAKAQTELLQEDREGAVDTMFAVVDIWKVQAQKPEGATSALEKILELDPSNRKAYEGALELYQRGNDWRAYAQVIDRYLPHLVTDEERVASLQELGRLQETKLGSRQVAFLQYCRALQLVPGDEATRRNVERLAEETGSFDELAAVYEEVAETVPRGPLAEQMYLTLAMVQDEKLDDPAGAETSLRKILEFDPTNELVLDRLGALFSKRGADKQYVVALEQKLEAAPTIEKRKEILREIARVYDGPLQRTQDAEQALSRSLELEPDLHTLGTLAAIQRRDQRHEAVASTLLRMRDIAPTPEERAKFQVEVAQVHERDLRDDESAVMGYRQALEFDPANGPALEALEQLYSKLDRPAELLQVYERQLEITNDYRERVRILFKSASIWEERYQNLANADACIEAALQVDPQSLAAIKALERLRKAQGRWEELVGVVDRHIQLLTSPKEKAELCVELGDVFHQNLRAVDRAVRAYHQALDLDPKCIPALHALGTLYERSGNWPSAVEMLEKEATVLGQTSEAVELWFRMGKINEDMLIDSSNAKRCFLEALRVDASYLPAISSLKNIYELERDFEAYEKALLELAHQTTEPQAKAQALIEVGRFEESKENRPEAVRAYEEALKFAPGLIDAAKPLADMYLSLEDFPRCEKMLELVTRQMSLRISQQPDDNELSRELCRRYYRLGYVCEKNQNRDKALVSYEKAYQIDATYLPVLEAYGNLLVQAQRYDEGQRVLQSILVHHRGDLTDLEVAEIYFMLGDLHSKMSQLDRAENHLEKALAIDPSHEPTLHLMMQISELNQRWDKAADYGHRLLEVVEGPQKFEVGTHLGKLAKEKLGDPYMSIDAYAQAHRVKPDALEVMDALYVLLRETKQSPKSAEMLEKMLQTPSLVADAPKARRVWFALGELNRDELSDFDKATACFNSALDLDWRFVEAFSAMEAMLGKHKKWKTLDENYKRMIARMPKTEETRVPRMTLWKALGDMYLNVYKANDAAVEAYKVVAQGMPENVEIQEQFAVLAQGQAGYEDQAVEAWRRALPQSQNPGKVASALAELAAKKKDYDSAWLAAQVVVGLIGEGGVGEKEILSKLNHYAKKREVAQRPLTDRLWGEHLLHPKSRGPLSEILAILYEQASSLYKEEFARYGISPKKHVIDVASSQEYQIHHYRYVSRLFGMEQVAIFSPFLTVTRDRMAKRTSEPAPDPVLGIEVIHTDPVAIRLGGKFFSETGQKEIYYMLGRSLALLRPELALTQRLSAERLEAVVQAAISLSVDRFRFTADIRAIDVERKALDRQLTQQGKDALARVTKQYVASATPNDLRTYLEGAELSATRAGAFVAGDIEPVRKMVLAETGGNFRLQPRTKIRDLMSFALGGDLHALRVSVGTSVEVQIRK
jgi:golgin subfamily B member 1